MFLTELLKTTVEGIRIKKENVEVIRKVDILKWEHELKPEATKLSGELDIPYEEALTYVKSIDSGKGSSDFKAKLQKLMDGMKVASETLNIAMDVDEQTEHVKESTTKNKTKKKKLQKVDNVFEMTMEEPEVYIPDIPEIHIPKL